MFFKWSNLFPILYTITLIGSINSHVYQLNKVKAKRYLSLRSLSPINTISGNSYEVYYYYAYLYLGNPPKAQSYITDTGSSITTAPCQPFCTHCGQHENSYYNVANSSQVLKCNNEFCNLVSSSCSSEKCSFSISYSEGSSLKGIYINETVRFGDDYNNSKGEYLPIGCTTSENNLFYTQLADGIMGLSNSDLNFVTMLYKRHLVKNNLFSLCLAQDGGYMSFGEVYDKYHKEKITYVNGDRGGFYYIKVNGIKLNKKEMSLNKANTNTSQYSAFIDSGTTVTYLPKAIFEFLINSFQEHCEEPAHKGKCGVFKNNYDLGPCYDFTSKKDMENAVFHHWPNITYTIDNQFDYVLEPKNYWFDNTEGKKYEACLGFMQEYGSRLTLGGTWMHGHDIIFDRGNSKIGFALSDCSRGKDIDQSSYEGENTDEKHEPKEDPKVEPKEDPKEEPKEDPKEEPKEDPKVEPKENTGDENQKEKEDEVGGLEMSLYLLAAVVVVLTILIIILIIAIRRLKNGQSFLCIKINNGYQVSVEQPSVELSSGPSVINSNREKKNESNSGLAKVKIVDS